MIALLEDLEVSKSNSIRWDFDRFSQDDADSDYSDGDDDPIEFDDEGRLVIGAPHSHLLLLVSAGWVKNVLDG